MNKLDSVLRPYFSGVWQQDMTEQFSGSVLQYRINDMKPNSVLDVGCGYHHFKGKIDNIIGIDPYNDKADIMVSIEDYNPDNKFDVILCLGSINFGDESVIQNQLTKIDSLLNDNGYVFFRCNPGLKHHWNQVSDDIPFYPWSLEKIVEYTIKFNYHLVEFRREKNRHGSERLFFVAQKCTT